jgi:hypothetical protein
MSVQCHACIGGTNLGEDIRKLDYGQVGQIVLEAFLVFLGLKVRIITMKTIKRKAIIEIKTVILITISILRVLAHCGWYPWSSF